MNIRKIGNILTPGPGQPHRSHLVIVNVLGPFLQIRDGNELVKNVTRSGEGEWHIRVPRR
jgi:hypothetical protein